MEQTAQLDKLTARVKAGGCASKLSPKILDRVLANVPRWANPNVLIGFDTADDAGVYQLTPDLALVQRASARAARARARGHGRTFRTFHRVRAHADLKER